MASFEASSLAEETSSNFKIEAHPRMEGRQMPMVLSPK
jgi:translation initiation factor IF-3